MAKVPDDLLAYIIDAWLRGFNPHPDKLGELALDLREARDERDALRKEDVVALREASDRLAIVNRDGLTMKATTRPICELPWWKRKYYSYMAFGLRLRHWV